MSRKEVIGSGKAWRKRPTSLSYSLRQSITATSGRLEEAVERLEEAVERLGEAVEEDCEALCR